MKKIIIILVISLMFISSKSLKDDGYVESSNESRLINSMLINNENRITKDYKPIEPYIVNVDFVEDAIEEEKQMEKIAGMALERLFDESSKEGIHFLATSAYRSYEEQERIYNSSVIRVGKKKTEEKIAIPGTSEHQTGLSIDVTNYDRWFVEETKEAQWLEHNAHRFGFIIRYPKGKEHITGKTYEPWHIRYVGEEAAHYIYENNITLEEYLDR